MLTLLLTLTAPALAQDATTLSEPLPIAGSAWSALVTAFALPPQKASFITTDAPLHACALSLALQPSGSFEASVGDCPEPMKADALAAARQWRFAPESLEAAQGPTRLDLRFVLQYSEVLGATTLHAEIDPGAAHTELSGAPGVQLVHRASVVRPVEVKLSKKQVKQGLGATSCAFQATIGANGSVSELAPVAECPPALHLDATKRLRDARWLPRTVDGVPYPDTVPAVVTYTP